MKKIIILFVIVVNGFVFALDPVHLWTKTYSYDQPLNVVKTSDDGYLLYGRQKLIRIDNKEHAIIIVGFKPIT